MDDDPDSPYTIESILQKLVGITLPIREFGSHLNSQKNVVDEELVQKNFKYGDLSSKTRGWDQKNFF
ncbi:hypothetical protein RhiirA5_441413 [Rhizophagus irregularis]|uniref:Uncharacterized protein n=1 Tax=Rhizophagus irregularis TaxID=588596 RepID=A0A2N0NFM5_9GLOM|nr:hypothetical protein RhiirA5_441413 [Rhizophagus irregularis]